MPDKRPLLAVLIDADNTSPKHAAAIFEEVARFGEASVRRIYGDFASNQLAGWNRVLLEHGLNPQQSPAYTTGKNSSDIALVIDAMDLLHTDRFQGFVLVSSDSDFTSLAARIREQGVDVYGIGQKKTPDAFRRACKRFIFVENLGDTAETTPTPSDGPKGETKEAPQDVIPLVLAAMRSIDPDADWYTLGQLGQYLVSATPEFDPRTYGSAKLSDLLRKSGRFEVAQRQGNHLEVRRLD
ncbi:OST-HTH/LOTUS domain-containing protein [Loktanella sp. DSM 29012]|uniref:NYN domain-containing protein n=1 Tax=Loktanella gaetbuli TaxID=2881335 RepID=A0ABS8BW55_9RHOB|nr:MULTISPECIES: NYN domain-containing protein [Loktanella]KQI68411.1 Maebl [Loktanella sp. 3ANDIMAR09]MCB5199942.1 NYN domain-containing protein [Loktanella gaetbuli]SEQ43177.1 OST-HTH/LOTUS domain-containing protein [Loktanella sp. DSM 29012]